MRYANEDRTWVPYRKAGETVQIVTRPPTVWQDQSYHTYVTTAADSMSSLAFVQYGTPEAWWLIADMNPRIVCPDDLRPGDPVQIPLVT